MAIPHENELTRRFQDNLRRLRLAAGFRQKDLADRMGWTSVSYVSHLESGRRHPSFESIAALAALFRVDPGTFFTALPDEEGFVEVPLVPWSSLRPEGSTTAPSKHVVVGIPRDQLTGHEKHTLRCAKVKEESSVLLVQEGAIVCLDLDDVPQPKGSIWADSVYAMKVDARFFLARIAIKGAVVTLKRDVIPGKKFPWRHDRFSLFEYPEPFIGRVIWIGQKLP